jgi:hypothetical protein
VADFANVSGQRVVSMSLGMPKLGAWVADVVLAAPQPLPSGPLTLVLGNLSLSGAVYRQDAFAGLVNARLVAGAAGWSNTVQPRGYNNPAGVLLSTVLGDAALEVGEQVNVMTDGVVGRRAFGREQGPASDLLRAYALPLWWIDSHGVTQVGPRPSPTVRTSFEVEQYDGGRGELLISTEDYASWLPGAQFNVPTISSTQTLACVRHVVSNDGRARMHVLVR